MNYELGVGEGETDSRWPLAEEIKNKKLIGKYENGGEKRETRTGR